ncbi:MAG: bifunctional glycosyltransferase/CDP-glycerol:glycerophosphate glycerophosphotransferase, partial [Nocardioidaceae bacterium]
QRAAAQPLLTVVVPVYNVADYLPECLDSALGQTLANLEVIAVDDGSTDACPQILEEYAKRDPRVRVFHQTNSGQGIARNLGVSHARGEFLTFLDSDDTVPPGAYEHMVATLQRTGSDLAVGSVRRFRHNQQIRTVWARTVHQADRLATTLEDFPNAMQDIIACNRMFRTAFWREKVGGFRGHIAYEDHVPMLAAYVRAEKFDILSRVTYNWRLRENLTSTGQQKATLPNLLDRIEVKEEANALLRKEASDFVYDLWVARALEVDFPAFISHAVTGDEMYRRILSAVYATFLHRASPRALAEVRVYQKIRASLIAAGRWDDLDEAEDYFRTVSQLPPTRVEDGKVVASITEESAFFTGLSTEVRELSPLETHFEGVVDHVRWLGSDRLQVTGWALIRGLAAPDRHPDTHARLVNTATGATVELDLTPLFLPEATLWAGHHNADVDGTGFTVEIDVAALARASHPGDSWRLGLDVSLDGVHRAGSAHNRTRGSSAARPWSMSTELDGRPCVVRPGVDPEHGFALSFESPAVVAEELTTGPGHVASGVLRLDDADLPRPKQVRATGRREKQSVTARLRPEDGHRFRFELRPERSAGEAPESWDVAVVLADDSTVPLSWSPQAPDAIGTHGAGQAVWRRDRKGAARLLTDTPLLSVHDVVVTDDEITLTIASEGLTEELLRGTGVANARTRLELLSFDPGADDTCVLRFSKLAPDARGALRVAPSGHYSVLCPLPDGTELPARCALALRDTLPQRIQGGRANVRLWMSPGSELKVELMAPLRVDERGATKQVALRRRYQTAEVAPRESVLFQCYRGEFATDSQRALDEGLRRARPDLTRYWGVNDHSVEVPEGSVPVLMGSREWYDVLASSRYLCNNIDFDGFFRKRPFQRYLQTFHGYPFKSMGATFWLGKGMRRDQVAYENARRNREWDAILVPSEMCAEFYRREYDYEGEILVSGYPRDDFIVNADRDAVRTDVLGALGVATDKTVVLYAPTYRDKLTTKSYTATLFDELDLEELVAKLGPDHVILLRGHNNNQRAAARVNDLPQVVDVTDYPEINELTVAADAAILDYSSLRFDWALTRRPAVFFVPDVDEYFATRPPLFDYAGTAPGPWLSTTQEVAEALLDLPAVQREYAGQVEEFNRRFNQLHDGHATERVIDAFFR